MVGAAYRLPALIAAAALAAGCTTERVIERPVPMRAPALCTTDCDYPARTPATNGELLEDYQARGAALACYAARLQCIRDMQETLRWGAQSTGSALP